MKHFVFPVFPEYFRNFCRKAFEKQTLAFWMVIFMGVLVKKFCAGLSRDTFQNHKNLFERAIPVLCHTK